MSLLQILADPTWRVPATFAAMVLVAALIGRIFPERRRRLRRVIVPFLAYFVFLGLSFVLHWLGSPRWAEVARDAARLVELLLGINLAGLTLFDLLLPLARVKVPNIVHELSLGVAYVVSTIAFLRHQGLDFSSVVATSAVLTAVLAFSMQATLGNVLGGVALQLDDSINVGDWIQLDSKMQGQVKEIRWRHTVIETRDWDTVIVPNSTLLQQNIIILGKRQGQPTQHRMWVRFNVDFRTPPATVIDAVEQALRAAPIPGMALRPPPNCICLDFAHDGRDSFAHYAVRYWLNDLAADDPTSSAVRVRIYTALKRANIPLAMPAARLFVAQEDEAHVERKALREQSRRRRVLDDIALFAPLTTEEKQQLVSGLRYAPFTAGEVITREGQTAHWLYILHQGKVSIQVTDPSGVQKLVGTLEAPNVFGEHGLMTGEARSATVVALTDIECYRLGKDVFHQILSCRPQLAEEISTIVAQRKMELESAKARIAAERGALPAAEERGRVLEKIQKFFGLDEE